MQHGSQLVRTLHETVNYPPHPPRKPTRLYQRTHDKLINEMDLPCLVCGVHKSTLGDPAQNPFGATQLETHHRLIEDSLANAVDVSKFNRRILPGLLRKTGNHEKYGHPFAQQEMCEWIHGDEDNMWVLCDLCHRHPRRGIHSLTGPIFGVQDVIFDGYDLTGFVAHSPEEAKQLEALPLTTGKPTTPRRRKAKAQSAAALA